MASSAPTVQPQEVTRRVGDTNDKALAYVLDPDPRLSRLSRKNREALLADLPPVTAGALLGPAALARHFIASAASGRYRDLFALWHLFTLRPEECKPVLAERPAALSKAREALGTAVRLGLTGRADRVATDVEEAQGLIWQWLREAVLANPVAVGARPAVASALLQREPDAQIPLPENPGERWLSEAAAARQQGSLAPAVEAVLAQHVDRLPATIATLALAQANYPEHVDALLQRVDLDSPEIGSIMAWARDHGHAARLRDRVREHVAEAAARDRAEGLARWYAWTERGIDVELPADLRRHSLEGLDLTRPESGVLLARLIADGAPFSPQAELDGLASRNRQLAEKAFEAFVCAGLDVTLPPALEGNPIVRDGTRCPYCLAWTWVRPGHERRCPRQPDPDAQSPPPASAPAAGGLVTGAPAASKPAASAPAADAPAAGGV